MEVWLSACAQHQLFYASIQLTKASSPIHNFPAFFCNNDRRCLLDKGHVVGRPTAILIYSTFFPNSKVSGLIQRHMMLQMLPRVACIYLYNHYLPSAMFIEQVLVGSSKQLRQIIQIGHNIGDVDKSTRWSVYCYDSFATGAVVQLLFHELLGSRDRCLSPGWRLTRCVFKQNTSLCHSDSLYSRVLLELTIPADQHLNRSRLHLNRTGTSF